MPATWLLQRCGNRYLSPLQENEGLSDVARSRVVVGITEETSGRKVTDE